MIQLFLMMATCGIAMNLQDRALKQQVSGETPPMFPILVITPQGVGSGLRADIVYQRDLPQFLENHPEFSYLVPPGQEEVLNSQLRGRSRAGRNPPDFNAESGDPWQAHFRVEQLSEGRQNLEVFSTWDDDRMNTGWYEATDKDILPQYHSSYFGPGTGFNAFFLTALVWGVGYAVYYSARFVRRALRAQ